MLPIIAFFNSSLWENYWEKQHQNLNESDLTYLNNTINLQTQVRKDRKSFLENFLKSGNCSLLKLESECIQVSRFFNQCRENKLDSLNSMCGSGEKFLGESILFFVCNKGSFVFLRLKVPSQNLLKMMEKVSSYGNLHRLARFSTIFYKLEILSSIFNKNNNKTLNLNFTEIMNLIPAIKTTTSEIVCSRLTSWNMTYMMGFKRWQRLAYIYKNSNQFNKKIIDFFLSVRKMKKCKFSLLDKTLPFFMEHIYITLNSNISKNFKVAKTLSKRVKLLPNFQKNYTNHSFQFGIFKARNTSFVKKRYQFLDLKNGSIRDRYLLLKLFQLLDKFKLHTGKHGFQNSMFYTEQILLDRFFIPSHFLQRPLFNVSDGTIWEIAFTFDLLATNTSDLKKQKDTIVKQVTRGFLDIAFRVYYWLFPRLENIDVD